MPFNISAQYSAVYLLSLLFTIWMIIDCIRGRNEYYWIFIMLIFQPIGALVYFAVYKLPEYEVGARLSRLFSGGRRVRELKAQIHHMDRPYHWVKLGDEYRAQRKWEEARQAYAAALEREPHNEEAAYGLALVQVRLGANQPAIETLEPLVAQNPRYDYGNALIALARAWRAAGRPERARAAYEEALKHYSYSEVQFELGELLYDQGERGEGRQMMDRIIADAGAASGFARARERRWARKARIFLLRNPA